MDKKFRYKLYVKVDGHYYFKILEQPEYIRYNNDNDKNRPIARLHSGDRPIFISRNSYKFFSRGCPEITDKEIFLRGDNSLRDEEEVYIDSYIDIQKVKYALKEFCNFINKPKIELSENLFKI